MTGSNTKKQASGAKKKTPPVEETFDPFRADAYVDHLADLDEVQEVIASEDILNEFGVLLVPKGARIKKSIADRLMGHKVEKPVHQVVSLSGCLNERTLLERFRALINAQNDLKELHKANNYDDRLAHLCTCAKLPLALLQKLTVMMERLPKIFHRSLFSAWFGSMLANEIEPSPDFVYNTFLAGLFHDLGLLHIDPHIVNKTKDVTEEEWMTLKTHINIGKQLVEGLNMVDPSVLRAIDEHHERCDGTGYPFHKNERKLGRHGQLIALAETVHALRFIQFGTSGKDLGDIKPYLMLNQRTYFYHSYKAALTVISRAELPSNITLKKSDFERIKAGLIVRNTNLDALQSQFRLLYQYLGHTSIQTITAPLLVSINNSLKTIQRSGVVGTDIGQWLESTQPEEFAEIALEMQELTAMQYELLFNLRRSFRFFEEFFGRKIKNTNSVYDLLKDLSEEISGHIYGAWATLED